MVARLRSFFATFSRKKRQKFDAKELMAETENGSSLGRQPPRMLTSLSQVLTTGFWIISTVGGMLMVEIFSIAKSFPLSKFLYLGKISMAKSLHIMNLSAVGDKMT